MISNNTLPLVWVGLIGVSSALAGFFVVWALRAMCDCCGKKQVSKKSPEKEEEERYLREFHEVL